MGRQCRGVGWEVSFRPCACVGSCTTDFRTDGPINSFPTTHATPGWSDDHDVDEAWVAADPSTFLRAHLAWAWTGAAAGVMAARRRGMLCVVMFC